MERNAWVSSERICSIAMTRWVRSPEDVVRKKSAGSWRTRSTNAAVTDMLARVSIRRNAMPVTTWVMAVPIAIATSTIPTKSSSFRLNCGMTEPTTMPVRTGTAAVSAAVTRVVSTIARASRPLPRTM